LGDVDITETKNGRLKVTFKVFGSDPRSNDLVHKALELFGEQIFNGDVKYNKKQTEATVTIVLNPLKLQSADEAMTVADRVKGVIAEELGRYPEEIELGDSLEKDLGFNFGDKFELIELINEEFKMDIPDEAVEKMKTVGDIVNYIEENGTNAAMATDTFTKGGIDLNTSNGMQWKVSKDGKGVEMNLDPAMIERIRSEGIDSLSPVIFRITPITSIWPLVGLQKPVQTEHLAAV
jgi:acyl carrier protein